MNKSLYIRSCYSPLDSLIKIEDLITKAIELDYDTLALVDFNMNGAINFYKALKKANIKAIYGLEVPYLYDNKRYHVCLYAKNNEGFYNLYKLSTLVNGDNKIINKEILKEFRDDLVIVVRSDSGLIYHHKLEELKEEFKDFYLGLIHNDHVKQKEINDKAKIRARELNIKVIAYPNTYYLNKEDLEAYGVLQAIKLKTTITDPNLVYEEDSYLLKTEEVRELYEDIEIEEAYKLADSLVIDIEFKKTSLPIYKCPIEATSKDYLVNLAKAGLNKRLKGKEDRKYLERLNKELKVIIDMDFTDYFLIVYDFILYAKKNAIMVGPGRGSAAGSLVSYCLGITDIDPIKYDLIFERFLNPERISMPDIDIDFPDDKRDLVINYVKNKYGEDHVGHILTYGTLKTKQVLRDVARVIGYERIDSLCKSIPGDRISLAEAYKKSRYFKERIDYSDKSRKLYEIGLKLEGLPRHFSTHAAGIVLSREKLKDIIPLVRVEEDMYSCGFTLNNLEEFGLIKIDFLGLRNLSVIAEIVDDIKKDNPSFSIDKIALDDPKTYKLISDVNTLGIFQLESSGMQKIIRALKPKTFMDIATTIALFRPGPMENIPLYMKNRHNKAAIEYLHPSLKAILEETSGVIIYQEQIMMIAQKLAGLTFAKADILRRAMSKKDESLLVSLKNDFIEGCINNNIDKNIAIRIYDLIMRFANYGFNKSHSVAYALIAYEEAYLKANYPLYFYKALLNGSISSSNKTLDYIQECKRINLNILAPHINKSYDIYKIENRALRMPLGFIKNVGTVSVKFILKDREERGLYKDYLDAVIRLKSLGKGVLEALIDAGAFDGLANSRGTMKINLVDALKVESGMIFDASLALKIREVEEDMKEASLKEKEVFGFAFTINPLLEYRKRYDINTESLYELKNQRGHVAGFGLITRFKEHTTKNGQKMAFLTISDDTDMMDLVILPNLYERRERIILNMKGKYVYFEGEIRKEASCTVDKIEVKEG